MKTAAPPARTAVAALASSVAAATPDTRLAGRRLLLARLSWGALATAFVVVYGASLPGYVAFLQLPCAGDACLIDGAVTQAGMQALQQIGFTPGGYTALVVVPYVLRVLLSCLIGAVIAWRRSDDWMALFVALFLIAFAFGNRNAPPDVLPLANATWWLPVHLGHTLFSVLLYLFFFLFPSGRFVPRWTGWVAAGYVLQQVAELVLPRASPTNFENWPFVLGVLFYFPLYLTALWAQIHRYRRVSTPAQRQQTKWVVVGVVAAAGGLLGASILLLLVPALQQARDLATLLGAQVVLNLPIVLAACIGVAALRYRLFDIDLIIRLTLVYGTLTALLAAVYLGLVLAGQVAVQGLTGEAGEQPAVIVASTLLVVALSTPLRRGVRAAVDRRFYRRKADAERVFSAFGATLGQEVELERLRARLVAVVEETMRPEHASLWLRAPDRAARGSHGPS